MPLFYKKKYINKIMQNNNTNIIPVATYSNAEKYKYKISEENKGKSGIYRWINLVTGKSYIGSAKCLSNRLNTYYSTNKLKKSLDRGSSAIYSALLKHGYSKFKVEILEYCELDVLISREQYFLDLLNPEYNICKVAGSTLGKVHSKSTKEKIGNSIKGKNHPFWGKHHTFETKEKIRIKLLNRIHIMPKRRLETKLKLSLTSIGMTVKVYDSYNRFLMEFRTINSTARYFGVSSSTISRILKNGMSYKNLFFKSEIKDNRIFVYDNNHKLIKVLNNKSETTRLFNIPHTTLTRYIKSEKLWKEKYYFYAILNNK